jgi:hypothetical protein
MVLASTILFFSEYIVKKVALIIKNSLSAYTTLGLFVT